SLDVLHGCKPLSDLPEDEMEIGIGIHGERGRTRTKHKTQRLLYQIIRIDSKTYLRRFPPIDGFSIG
ncbi:MAG TPA: dihydroxyacetone kinase subunit DhaK, partial [Chthoniobacterales bacterium]|nr:dihydroxyacetone kinase subunit DhaK [Chthoniobacterales bacterium]